MKARRDFLAARRSPTARTPAFILAKRVRGDDGPARIGLTVTKKLGGAVTRNRIRRRIREAAAAAFPGLAQAGCDYVAIARPAAATRPFATLLDDMNRALLSLSTK
ncbi:MAG: ribonuclease P protein component [Parvularculaceae bacterium]